MKYKTIDLCAGIGGIRKGFELTRHFKNIKSAEIDEYAARTYSLNFNGEDPRNDLTSDEFKDSLSPGSFDVLLAGFPCQPFSSQGKQEGFGDPTKGTIFFHIKQIVCKNRPKVIFLENVQNIVSHKKGNTIHVILDSLERKLNYKVVGVSYDEKGKFVFEHYSFVRNTKKFGLPQNRPRAFFVAFDKKLYGNLLDDIEDLKKLPEELPARLRHNDRLNLRLEDIIEPQVDLRYYMSRTYLQTLRNHKARQAEKGNGYGYCILNENGEMRDNANTILATGGSGKERNLIIQPMPPHNQGDLEALRKKGGVNDENVRMMTPTEWGRLQGFIGYAFLDENGNETFRFPDSVPLSQRYKQFGNAVSIPVIETMADYIYGVLMQLERHPVEILRNYEKNYSRDFGPITNDVVCKCLNVGCKKAQLIIDELVEKEILQIQLKEGSEQYYFCQKE